MDAVARRFMWQVISDITTKRQECCVILTTHSMYVGLVFGNIDDDARAPTTFPESNDNSPPKQ